jgi:cation diffusion facilitator family transporter
LNADAWHHRADALSSALAFIGISVALIGGKGYESADDWAAIGAAVIIAGNACALLWPAILELVDTAPSSSLADDIRTTASRVDGVLGIGWCNVRKIGLTYAVELEVMMDGDITLHRGHAIADEVEEAIREAEGRITHVLVHLEPYEGGRPSALR